MRRIIVPSVACPALSHFSTISHKRHDLKKAIVHKKCVLIFSTKFYEIFLILRRIEGDVINAYRCSYNVPYILARF